MPSSQPDPEPALDPPPAGQSARRPANGWRVVARALNDHGDTVYDVYEGEARRAWGIKDRATALRWLTRLSGGAAEVTEGDDAEAEPAGYTPRRVWWNES